MPDPAVPPVVTPPASDTPVAPVVPDKFMKDGKPDHDAILKAYTELEKKQSGTPTPEVKPSATPESKPVVPTPKKMDKWTKEWTEGGNKLTDATYAEIESDLGLGKDEVDAYIAQRSTKAADFTTQVFEAAGSKEQYDVLAHWADANLKADEVASYNKAVASGDIGLVKIALSGLMAKYERAVGRDPKLVQATNAASTNSQDPFDTPEAAARAKLNPKYGKDQDYTKLVNKRIEASTAW